MHGGLGHHPTSEDRGVDPTHIERSWGLYPGFKVHGVLVLYPIGWIGLLCESPLNCLFIGSIYPFNSRVCSNCVGVRVSYCCSGKKWTEAISCESCSKARV